MIEAACSRRRILTTPGCTMSRISSFADGSLFITQFPAAVIWLYQIARKYCVEFSAVLHPEKCVPIPATSTECPRLPNGNCILEAGQATTILWIPTKCHISRDQVVQIVMCQMLNMCRMWECRERTIKDWAAVKTSIILATLWYVLSLLSINDKEINQIWWVVSDYMSNHKNLQWEDGRRRSQMNSNWY